ncbi:uncharacterized protein LOC106458957 [Limulus polyphemus]|uniref:Uncharacterized protein LOC106458957 n=1 Tax=Limulus polyphemus TaxID=6850 RepID=A0ABM1B3D7_LIMPO|nr:uncharacterized protein LOC106458957 [Limulus polyphemus]
MNPYFSASCWIFILATSLTRCLYGESLPEKSTKNTEKENVEALFSEFWTWRLQQSPEFASEVGNHTFDDRLDSYALEVFRKRMTDAERFLQIAHELLPNLEDGTYRSNLELLISELQLFVDGMKFSGYFFPVNRLEGVQRNLVITVNSAMKFDTTEDFRKLISRYRAFPKQAEEIIELMKEGIRQGRTNHAVSMKHVVEQFALLQKPVELSPFFKPFLSFPESVPSTEQETLKSEAKQAIEKDLLPAFKKLETFIEKLIKVLGKNSSRSDFFQNLRSDPRFFFKTKEDLLNAYKDTVDNIIRPKLPLVFKNIPKAKLMYVL